MWFFSLFSTYRALLEIGVSKEYAVFGHSVVAIVSLYYFWNIWCGAGSYSQKWLAFSLATLLVLPYSLDYDAVWITLPAIATFAKIHNSKDNFSLLIFMLIMLQIFAFVVISISAYMSFLLVVSTIALLAAINKPKYAKIC